MDLDDVPIPVWIVAAVALVFVAHSAGFLSVTGIGDSETTSQGTFTLTDLQQFSTPDYAIGSTLGHSWANVFKYMINGVDTGYSYAVLSAPVADGSFNPTVKTLSSTILQFNDPSGRTPGGYPTGATLTSTVLAFDYPAGENAQFKNVGVTLRANPAANQYNNEPRILYDLSLPVPKDSRLSLDTSNCPTPAGYDPHDLTLTYQIFDGSAQSVTLADFKHTVVEFCMSHAISVKLPSGNTEGVISPYGDVILKGSYAMPPGEVQTWIYLAPANEFPQSCPAGQAISVNNNGGAVDVKCIPADVSITCPGTWTSNGDCPAAHQSTPWCPVSGTVYDERIGKCTASTIFCPQGFVTVSPIGLGNSTFSCFAEDGSISQSVDGNTVCSLNYPGASYLDGKCVTPVTTVQTPSSFSNQNNSWLPIIAVLLIFAGGVWWFFFRH